MSRVVARMPASRTVAVPRRCLNIHEYQSAALMSEKGVNVPFGLPASTVEEAVAAANTIGDEEIVIKSQILAGGRGLGTFTNGLQGGVHVIKTSEVEECVRPPQPLRPALPPPQPLRCAPPALSRVPLPPS